MSEQAFIKVRNLRKTYIMGRQKVHALAGVDLDIPANSLSVVMGPSGSGKSTLLYLLGGLDRPTSGSMEVDGQKVEQMDEKIGKLTWLLNRTDSRPDPASETGKPPAYLEAMELADAGRSPAEIGKRLHLTRGEVQTLLDLKAYCLK